jgi:hypothetical protein
MKTPAEITQALAYHTGTSTYTRLMKGVLLTEGVVDLVDMAECHWLVSDIACHLLFNATISRSPQHRRIHFWSLDVLNEKADLTARLDTGLEPFVEQHYSVTDFPLPRQEIWATMNEGMGEWVLLLPSEY